MHGSSSTVSGSGNTSIVNPVPIVLAMRRGLINNVRKTAGRSRILHMKEMGYITRSRPVKSGGTQKKRDNRLMVFQDGSGQSKFAVLLVMSPIAGLCLGGSPEFFVSSVMHPTTGRHINFRLSSPNCLAGRGRGYTAAYSFSLTAPASLFRVLTRSPGYRDRSHSMTRGQADILVIISLWLIVRTAKPWPTESGP